MRKLDIPCPITCSTATTTPFVIITRKQPITRLDTSIHVEQDKKKKPCELVIIT